MSDLTNQHNFEGMKKLITAINVEINGFKNVNKSNETSYAGLTKQIVDIQSTMANIQNILPPIDYRLSYANIVKNGGSIQKTADKMFILRGQIRCVCFRW